ncbi:MAG: YigZ family protein, partial [Pedobacter sp.]
MLFDDSYKTINGAAEGIFRDKGSKFIAYAYPIRSEEEIKPLINNLRSEHAKARHFCYAYRLTPDRSVYRINDDGEPSGTAGRPILNCLLSEDLTNIIIVVVRYFGGTLLGVPGLINAYKNASLE